MKIDNKMAIFLGVNDARIAIPISKITGITEVTNNPAYGNCFIATGADGVDGEENGWYVKNEFNAVLDLLNEFLSK